MSIRVGRRGMARIMGAAARSPPDEYMEVTILSAYSMCSSGPAAEVVVTLGSTYALTLLVAEVEAFLYEGTYSLCKVANAAPVAALASTYALSTAVT